jgi:hypothetical protein
VLTLITNHKLTMVKTDLYMFALSLNGLTMPRAYSGKGVWLGLKSSANLPFDRQKNLPCVWFVFPVCRNKNLTLPTVFWFAQ